MPLSVQAKLLRVLDQGELLRVGGLKPIRVDVRFVAATNRDLEAEVQRGAFREDLFFRLNAVMIVVPPLRERVEEIAPLALTFAKHAARAIGRTREPVSHPTRWPSSSGIRGRATCASCATWSSARCS